MLTNIASQDVLKPPVHCENMTIKPRDDLGTYHFLGILRECRKNLREESKTSHPQSINDQAKDVSDQFQLFACCANQDLRSLLFGANGWVQPLWELCRRIQVQLEPLLNNDLDDTGLTMQLFIELQREVNKCYDSLRSEYV